MSTTEVSLSVADTKVCELSSSGNFKFFSDKTTGYATDGAGNAYVRNNPDAEPERYNLSGAPATNGDTVESGSDIAVITKVLERLQKMAERGARVSGTGMTDVHPLTDLDPTLSGTVTLEALENLVTTRTSSA